VDQWGHRQAGSLSRIRCTRGLDLAGRVSASLPAEGTGSYHEHSKSPIARPGPQSDHPLHGRIEPNCGCPCPARGPQIDLIIPSSSSSVHSGYGWQALRHLCEPGSWRIVAA
jgi:hypothetical protein